jgi:hypothetical protein
MRRCSCRAAARADALRGSTEALQTWVSSQPGGRHGLAAAGQHRRSAGASPASRHPTVMAAPPGRRRFRPALHVQRRQVAPGVRPGRVLGRAGQQDAPAAGAAFGAQVDHPVGGLDHVEVVLDHDDGVAGVAQLVQHLQQQLDVVEVQAGGGLVQDVQRAPGVALAELERQLHALRLAAGQRGRALAQADVAQAHVEQGLQLAGDGGHGAEEGVRVLDRHLQHLGDVAALVQDLQRLAVVALAWQVSQGT